MGETTRRTLLVGAAGVGAAVGAGAVLAACGSSTSDDGNPQGGATDTGDGSLGNASDIPVGGGKVFGKQQIVVTQPTAGEYKAFTAICTHQGCTVATVSDGTINCTCHGSKFSAADGSVKNGPAVLPLTSREIALRDGKIFPA